MANINQCESCQGNKVSEGRLNTTYEVTPQVIVENDQLCVHLVNETSTNVSVNVWAEDAENSGFALTDPNYWVAVPAQSETSICIGDLGYKEDGVSLRDKCILHLMLHNDDNENEGVEIWYEIYTGA